jgi:hypothetical protein
MIGYGSRLFDNDECVLRVIEYIRPEYIIHGAHTAGADYWIDRHATELGIQRIILPAAWHGHRNTGAGPYRNRLMAELGVLWAQHVVGPLVGVGFRLDEQTAGTRNMESWCRGLVRKGDMLLNRCATAETWQQEVLIGGVDLEIRYTYGVEDV